MCFNLFGPLVGDLPLATRCMRALLPGKSTGVTEVRIEYAPSPADEYLGDRTSFDAFVAYRRPDGQPAFLGIETKLTEPFSPGEYDKPTYRCDRVRRLGVATRGVGHDVELRVEPALAQPLARRGAVPPSRARVTGGEGDRCSCDIPEIRASLPSSRRTSPSSRRRTTRSATGRSMSSSTRSPACATPTASAPWIDAFRLRYLDLAASDGL